MHYARKGIITAEMEYVAIRENMKLQEARAAGLLTSSTPATASAPASRKKSPRSSSAKKSPVAARSFRPTSTTPNWNR
jgi:thiamine biosynthesis protein ThiC